MRTLFNNGWKFAEDNYNEIIKGLGKEAFYIVSHSEGGAYASGMADYLFLNGHTIGEHVLLSADEGDEFEINPAIPSYQVLYMYFSSIYNPILGGIKASKMKSAIPKNPFIKAHAITLPKCLQTKVKVALKHPLGLP